jgi:PAS domain S-box-containing protein
MIAAVFLLAALFVFVFYVALPVHRLVKKLGDYASARDTSADPPKFQNDAEVLAHVFKLLTEDLQTKENQLKEMVEKANDRARFMETYSDRLVESVPSAVLGFDENGRLAALNSNAEAIFRLRLADATGSRPLELFASLPGLGALLENAVDGGQVLQDSPWEMKEPSAGEMRYLEISGSPLPTGAGKAGGYVAVVHDRTSMKRLEAQARLNERLEALVDLSTGLAHQFRNPLGAILGYADLIGKQAGGKGETAEMAAVIHDEAVQLKKVVDEFLEFLRHRQSAEKPLKWSEVADNAARDLERRIKEKNAVVAFRVEGAESPVDLDRVSAYQAVSNLILNAVEAVPPGGRVEVVSSVSSEGSWSVLTVDDSGPGVNDAIADQIFHPFFTTKPDGKGLGLAVVQRVVQAAGGRMEVGRSPLGGARFALSLPVCPQIPVALVAQNG